MGQHRSASASRLLGLDGFEVLAAEVAGGEWRLMVQTTAELVGCPGCGVRAQAHGRRTVQVRDLPIGGRPVVLCWRKRIWRCREPACGVRTWTEQVAAIRPRAVLTQRARAEACRRVGKDAHAVAAAARDLGVGWATIMRAVGDHGRPLVDAPTRLEDVTVLGLDETSFLKATRVAPTRYVTGLVDLEGGRLLEVVADRTRAAVHSWLDARSREWLAHIGTVALDPWRGYASALVVPLGHATVVVDHFHAIKLANAAVDQVRRRTQQAALGHRGRKRDPLYRIRKLLLTAAEQLTSRGRVRLRAGLAAGDPGGEVAAAWQGKELLRTVYAADDLVDARAALGRFYRWADGVGVPELSRLARTVRAWEAEVLAFHTTDGCSNGPTDAMNLLIKKSSGSGTASATSPTTGCGCCCTAASGGRLTRPRNCEAAPHAWWRRAPRAGHPPLGSQVRLAAPRAEPDRPGGPLAVDLGRLLLGRGDLVLEPRTGGVGSIRGRAAAPR